ncbi:Skp1 family tetramerization domain-containing protein [Microdochium nivale]|nr:Skp1 family tetramerization domain-containing protein [Microdochium nivale]
MIFSPISLIINTSPSFIPTVCSTNSLSSFCNMLSKSAYTELSAHNIATRPAKHADPTKSKSSTAEETRAAILAILQNYPPPAAADDENHYTADVEPPFCVGTAEEAQHFPSTTQRSIWLKTSDDFIYRVSAGLVKDSCLISDIAGDRCIGGINLDMAIPLPSVTSQTLTLLLELLNGLFASQRLERASSSFFTTLMRHRRPSAGSPQLPVSRDSQPRTPRRLSSRLSAKAAMRARSFAAHEKRQTSPLQSDAMAKWFT